jgi:carbonic anhydrase
MKTQSKETQASITPHGALGLLREGNKRFVTNLQESRELLKQANETRDGQWPFATILSCIDSRTSAELIFDQGLGDVFSIRIAGTIINTDILGSMEFACKVAGSKLLVVLGHSSCGAIRGACDHVEMGNLTELLAKLQPAVYQERTVLAPEHRVGKNPDFVERVARINVKRSVKAVIGRSFILEHLVIDQKVGVVGAMHDLATGVVDFYEDASVFTGEDVERLRVA